MTNGALIALEGGEGGGKTTQIALLAEKLRAEGYDVLVAREPGGTRISEQIRQVVLDKENIEMVDEAEVLLYQASRAQIYAEVIRPALKEGKIVLMDRTSESSLVYQGMARGMGVERIADLNAFSTQNTRADLILLLDVPMEVGLGRIAQEKRDRLENAGAEFHEVVRSGYLLLAEADQENRWQVIDARGSLEEVAAEIWQQVQKFLEQRVRPTETVDLDQSETSTEEEDFNPQVITCQDRSQTSNRRSLCSPRVKPKICPDTTLKLGLKSSSSVCSKVCSKKST